ncbi:CidA/LrgA family protein [Clostridium sp. 1001271B_151109_B4]|uniref:CidA/LrgA family protein n=1 Tax=Clostridium sp. 1001271B_151109_B4 TaxID=2787148 RepID=UPI0018AA6837|nr:CidA/LrgA family protein [Clostridium sp. 1001271B_151109_B4]
MKFFRESILILSIYFAGEIISGLFHIPIPGNIIGMILLFLLLTSNILKVEKVETLSNFFLDHLAFFFIPASVGLMTSFSDLKGSILKIVLLCILTTIIVLSVTALTVEFICKKKQKSANDNGDKLTKKES